MIGHAEPPQASPPFLRGKNRDILDVGRLRGDFNPILRDLGSVALRVGLSPCQVRESIDPCRGGSLTPGRGMRREGSPARGTRSTS